jgi:hypothetical protein
MVKLKTIKFFFQPSHLLLVGHHAGVTTLRLSYYLIDDELGVSVDVKSLNPELGSDAHASDQGLILHHIIGAMEVQPKSIKESISFMRDRHYTSPGTIEGKGAIEVHAPMLLSDRGVGC